MTSQGRDLFGETKEPTFYDQALSQALYDHAVSHYEEDGWDVIVECWTLTEIDNHLGIYRVRSMEGALAAFGPLVGVWADRQADARNSAF